MEAINLKLEITKHAQERMDSRGISLPTIKAILLDGKKEKRGDGAAVASMYGMSVIVIGAKIITVFATEKVERCKKKKPARKRIKSKRLYNQKIARGEWYAVR